MVTLGILLKTLLAIDATARDSEVRLVTAVKEIDRGKYEGGLALTTRPIAGIAVGKDGLFLFVDNNDEQLGESIMPSCPPGFMTGDAEIDKRRAAGEQGEEWKNG